MPGMNFDDTLIYQTLLPETSALPHFGVIPTSSPSRVALSSHKHHTPEQKILLLYSVISLLKTFFITKNPSPGKK
jgi:hypothetical protein